MFGTDALLTLSSAAIDNHSTGDPSSGRCPFTGETEWMNWIGLRCGDDALHVASV